MLHNLAASVPRGAILLIEDIDCAFPSRDADSDDDEDDLPEPTLRARPMGRPVHSARMAVRRQPVTMSGLLNLMDGVGSDDHRIIFATVSLSSCVVVKDSYP
jgi:chaperone BCS1